ncbi:hypothetical protein [Streptomyces showdoensis]|uniref:Uncharacterized protein n=1 Tax=Streptomyces showdoensis TaxID=68268 RepID=A0A2P2GTQ5_STREW|nr:hypothetical protein [Streptomyces showdoensis]KKZ74880.1 hypothetical protein VO63_05380 [Streptomyces showdoensis]
MATQLNLSIPTPTVIDPDAGETAKQAGMKRIGQLDPVWAADCDKKIEKFAGLGVPFQAADLVEDGLAEPPHPNCWGPRFSAAARTGLIAHAGYTQSKRATVHKSICHQWVGVKTEAAA